MQVHSGTQMLTRGSLQFSCASKHMYHEEWVLMGSAAATSTMQQLCVVWNINFTALDTSTVNAAALREVMSVHLAAELLVNGCGATIAPVMAPLQHLATAGLDAHVWLLAPPQGSAGLLGLAKVCNTEMQRLRCTYCEVGQTAADQMAVRITTTAPTTQVQLSVHSGQVHTTELHHCAGIAL